MVETTNDNFTGGNVPISIVASVMKKDPQFVRLALQKEMFPFGIAMKRCVSNSYSYYVSPKLFYEYTGYKYIPTKKGA